MWRSIVHVLNPLNLSETHSQEWLYHWTFSTTCIMR